MQTLFKKDKIMFQFTPNKMLYGFLLGLIACITAPAYAQESPEAFNPEKDTLVVALTGNEPFVMENKMTKEPEGIAVALWEELAFKARWHYRYKRYESIGKALQAIQRGKADMVVGPISITAARAKNVSFSQPYYNSSLSIASLEDQGGIWAHIKPFFSPKLLLAVAGFLFILAVVGALFWLAERKKSPDYFSEKPGKGIGQGMYLAIVTMSTVGYGDLAPRSAFGRILAGTWIVIAIVFATSMVAGIASALTLAFNGTTTINTIEQISDKKIATVAGTTSVNFIKENNGKLVTVASLDEAMKLLENHKVEAVVYDRPQLLYYKDSHKGMALHLSNAEYYKQGYGFAFPQRSGLVYEVNLKLLNLAEEQRVNRIIKEYLGSNN